MAMRYPLYLLLLAAVLTVPFSAQANTGEYTVTILGRVQHNYPDSTFNPACVNDNDVVAGSANVRVPDNFTRPTRGVTWNTSTHYTILGTISEENGYDSQAAWIKACAILNVEGFYDAFLAQADKAVKHGFVSEVHRSLVISGSDPQELFDQLERYHVPQEEKWYNR